MPADLQQQTLYPQKPLSIGINVCEPRVTALVTCPCHPDQRVTHISVLRVCVGSVVGLSACPATLEGEDAGGRVERRDYHAYVSRAYGGQGSHVIMCESIRRGSPGISVLMSTLTHFNPSQPPLACSEFSGGTFHMSLLSSIPFTC